MGGSLSPPPPLQPTTRVLIVLAAALVIARVPVTVAGRCIHEEVTRGLPPLPRSVNWYPGQDANAAATYVPRPPLAIYVTTVGGLGPCVRGRWRCAPCRSGAFSQNWLSLHFLCVPRTPNTCLCLCGGGQGETLVGHRPRTHSHHSRHGRGDGVDGGHSRAAVPAGEQRVAAGESTTTGAVVCRTTVPLPRAALPLTL